MKYVPQVTTPSVKGEWWFCPSRVHLSGPGGVCRRWGGFAPQCTVTESSFRDLIHRERKKLQI